MISDVTGDVNAEKSTFPTKYSLHLLLCIHFIYFQISKLIGNRSGSSFFFCRADLGENGLYISFFLDVDLLFVWRASRNTARPLLTFFLLLVMSTVYINNKRRDILFFFIFNFFFSCPYLPQAEILCRKAEFSFFPNWRRYCSSMPYVPLLFEIQATRKCALM